MKHSLVLFMITVLAFTGCADPSTKMTSSTDRYETSGSTVSRAEPRQESRSEELLVAITAIPLMPVYLACIFAGIGTKHEACPLNHPLAPNTPAPQS